MPQPKIEILYPHPGHDNKVPPNFFVACGRVKHLSGGPSPVVGLIVNRRNRLVAIGSTLQHASPNGVWLIKFSGVDSGRGHRLLVCLLSDPTVVSRVHLKYAVQKGYLVTPNGPSNNDVVGTSCVAYGTKDPNETLTAVFSRDNATAGPWNGTFIDSGIPEDWVFVFDVPENNTAHRITLTSSAGGGPVLITGLTVDDPYNFALRKAHLGQPQEAAKKPAKAKKAPAKKAAKPKG